MSVRRFSPIRLLVCDMAGTTINENGLVYQTLYSTMRAHGLSVSIADIPKWHGRNKHEVLRECVLHEAPEAVVPEVDAEVQRLCDTFDTNLIDAYFSNDSPLDYIDKSLPGKIEQLRVHDIRIALNTGYPKHIQEPIIKALHLDELVDGYISSGEVRRGRPYPYMIHQLMERFSIASTKEVIKVGDSSNDILEGLHAGCLASIGVTTGAEDAEALYAAGAKMVIESVMDIHPVCEHTVAIQSIP